MPLQKLHTQGSRTVDSKATKRRQVQERRRTLQTISELSATEVPPPPPDFKRSTSNENTSLANGSDTLLHERRAPSKRRSTPQYCARPECVQTRSPPPIPSIHIAAAQRAAIENKGQVLASSGQHAGWNARRERARLQAEQALSGTSLRLRPSNTSLQLGKPPTLLKNSPSPRPKSNQPYLRSYYSQQHSLRNSRSMTSTPTPSERRSSIGSSSRDAIPRDHEVDSSERTSTDSSSFRSSRESAMRTPRSSSSSQSFTLQGVPPLPSGCPQPTSAYYSTIHSPYHNGYPYQLPGPMYVQAPSEIRTTSLPIMRFDSMYMVPRSSYTDASTALRSNPPHAQHHHLQRPRPESLSSPTPPAHQRTLSKQPSRSSLKSSDHRHSTQQRTPPPPHHPQPHHSSPPKTHRRHSTSTPQAPPKAHIPHLKHALPTSQPPISHQPLPPRALPDREALTKWKSEREGAKADVDGVQRAKVKERVRRANEMEREKERELQKLGKGAEKGARVLGKGLSAKEKKGGRGCLGGWFGRVVGMAGGVN